MKDKRISTGVGDKGETSWENGIKVSKTDLRIEAIGTLDELNANLGLIIALASSGKEEEIQKKLQVWIQKLQEIQNILFDLGTIIFKNNKKKEDYCKECMDSMCVLQETVDIKSITNNKFILPGGSVIASQTHVTRTVCRRAERCFWNLNKEESINNILVVFLNRLSDFLFVLSLFENFLLKKKQIIWQEHSY